MELTRELNLLDELERSLLGSNVVALKTVVHEPDLDTIVVEERGSVGDTRENTG